MTLTLQDVNTVKDKERMRNFSVNKSIKKPDINTVHGLKLDPESGEKIP